MGRWARRIAPVEDVVMEPSGQDDFEGTPGEKLLSL
jgi:hypothetical protein